MAVVLDADDLDRDDVALFDDFLRVGDAAVDELRDVDQAFDRALQADEGAERRELRDLAGDDLPFAVAGDDLFPALGLGAADAEGDLLRLVVHLQDVDRHFVADLEQLVRRLRRALPGQLGEVDEAVGAADVDEDAEVADAGDAAGADVAFVQLEEQAFLLGGALLLDGGALREDGAVAAAVELDDLEGDVLADPLGERALGVLRGAALRAGDDLGQRDEGVDAFDVDEQAALVAAGDVAFERFVGVQVVLEDAPAALAAGAVEGEDDLAFMGLRLDDGDEDLVADA